MSRLDQPLGGFGGPRIVKPQANIYTVLLLIACLFVAAALGVEILRLLQMRESPPPAKTGAVDRPAVTAVAARAAAPIQRLA